MQGNTVGERDDSQEAVEFRHPYPMPDASILGLCFSFRGGSNGCLAPLDTDIGALGQHVIPEIVGHWLHDDIMAKVRPKRNQTACRPASADFHLEGVTEKT